MLFFWLLLLLLQRIILRGSRVHALICCLSQHKRHTGFSCYFLAPPQCVLSSVQAIRSLCANRCFDFSHLTKQIQILNFDYINVIVVVPLIVVHNAPQQIGCCSLASENTPIALIIHMLLFCWMYSSHWKKLQIKILPLRLLVPVHNAWQFYLRQSCTHIGG